MTIKQAVQGADGLREASLCFSNDDMLRMLVDLLASRGLISGLVIDEIEYSNWFGFHLAFSQEAV